MSSFIKPSTTRFVNQRTSTCICKSGRCSVVWYLGKAVYVNVHILIRNLYTEDSQNIKVGRSENIINTYIYTGTHNEVQLSFVATGDSESTAYPSSHCDGLSCDVGSVLRAQEGNHSANFLWLSNSEGGGTMETWYSLNYSYIFVHICDKLPCEFELYLLMLSCLLKSSMMSSFCHNWDKTVVYYRDYNTREE